MNEERALTAAKPVRLVRKSKRPNLGSLLRLRFGSQSLLTDDLFAAICAENRDLRFERTATGSLEIMAPAGSDGSRRNLSLSGQLWRWIEAEGQGLGVGFDSSGGFILPNTATRSPDASWVSLARWEGVPAEDRDKFLPLCPDFVVELRSKSDGIGKLRKKMAEYIEQGARLGWLIDPSRGVVEVYRAGKKVERLEQPTALSGEEVLPGFVLQLKGILGD